MFRKTFFLATLLLSIGVNAQNKFHEIGGFIGAGYYMGELNQSKIMYNPQPAFSIIYKVDFNSRYALRFSGTYAKLSGNDANSNNEYQIQRNHSFDISITEFSTSLEFNFLPYKPASRFEYFSPYISIGLGVLLMPSEKGNIHPIIPFGFGFKYAINKKLGIAAEWSYRKTFTDYIDQLPQQEYTEIANIDNKQRTYSNSKDWYSFAGITLTYKFAFGSSECPAYRN